MQRVFVAIVVALSVSSAVFAQGKLLDHAPERDWDVKKSGPLLIVDAPGKIDFSPNALDSSAGLMAMYGRQIVRVGSLTVWASATTRTYLEPQGKPDLWAGAPYSIRRRRFLDSLNERQRGLVLSERGIGLDNLNLDQQRYFLASLPDPLLSTYRFSQAVSLTGDERRGVRLRAARVAKARLIFTEPTLTKREGPEVSLSEESRAQVFYGTRISVGEFSVQEARHDRAESFGQWLGATVFRDDPGRFKPSDLGYDSPALARFVAVDGAKTVGELIVRVATATGVEIYADPRLAAYRVRVLGDRVSAKDILKGLARSLDATFRKVEGEAWLLVDDREPVAVRTACWEAWAMGAVGASASANRLPWEKSRAPVLGVLSGVADGKQSLLLLPFAVRSAIQANREEYGTRKRDATVDDIRLQPGSFDDSAVQIASSLIGQLVLPDGRSLDDSVTTSGLSEEAARYSPPEPSKRVALSKAPTLWLAAATAEEAVKAVRLASQAGVRTLWLDLPLADANGEELGMLRAAIREGKRLSVSVGATLHLLAAPPDPSADDRDTPLAGKFYFAREWPRFVSNSLSGTAFDWVAPDAPGVAVRVAKRVAALAALDGLAGLAFFETAPPGYERLGMTVLGLPIRRSFGGRSQNRLSFLRRFGADPLDFDSGELVGTRSPGAIAESGISLLAPQLSAESGDFIRRKWGEFLSAKADRLLAEAYRTARARSATLPLYLAARNSVYLSWLSLWERADRIPASEEGKAETEVARTFSKTNLGYVRCYPGQFAQPGFWEAPPTPDGAEALARAVEAKQGWPALLLDLRSVPLEEILHWLEGVSFPR